MHATELCPLTISEPHGIAGGQFLENGGHRHGVGARSSPFFRHHDPEETELAHFVQFGFWKVVRLVPLRSMRRQSLLGEGARHIADHRLLLVEDHLSRTFLGPS